MSLENNPLKQYFRRPAIYLKLPSLGKMYDSGVVDLPENSELPIYPMTAIDEITARTPDALFNGAAMVDIMKSCVPNIKNPWAIKSVDLDAILIAIRAATNGNMLEIESTCPSCTEDASYNVNLIGLLSKIVVDEYNNNVTLDEMSVAFKPITYKSYNKLNLSQFELEKNVRKMNELTSDEERLQYSKDMMKQLNELTMLLVSESIDNITTPSFVVNEKEYILDFLHNCDRNSFVKLKEHTIKLREDAQLKPLPVKCIHCEHEYNQTIALNVSDFFE
jgi:hypothetical protein